MRKPWRHYRLSDNYMRFYLRFIEPAKKQILDGRFTYTSPTSWPGWDTIMGLQFENLVLSNALSVFHALHIQPSDVVQYGAFFQRKTARQRGVQIDLLIQTRYGNLFICEVKFSASPLGRSAVQQLVEKRSQISIPRGFSVRLVLVHVNGVKRSVSESEELHHLIDFSELIR